jgi:photosystem II stability/assembly factor-like uncharacterized protein
MRRHRTTRSRILFAAGLLLAGYPLVADLPAFQGQGGQGGGPPRVINKPTEPALQGFRFREIGPTGQGGRIDDLAFDERNPSTFYIGYAVSGLWKTVNNGTTFEPLFDEIGHSIGDLALAPSNPNVLYVGTGEPNNRQSSSFGEGVYKSTDAGKTFTHIGLRETESIARIIVHPKNPDIVWVAAVGKLFGPNPERGVFMSMDGGKTWIHSLKINQDVGATELTIDPSNPNHLFAATYERRRQSWGFVGGGPGSGIYETMDGGKTWTRLLATAKNGLPRGTMGRVALDWSRSNPNVIYAQIEVARDKEPRDPKAEAAAAEAARAGGAGRGGGGGGGGQGRGGGAQTPDPTTNGIWRSMDKGKTWEFRSNENQRPMYFSQIRVDPNNPEVVYVGGVGPRKSIDGAKTFTNLQGMGHVDNHAIWIDPNNSQHVVYGNDGGLDISYDGGATWESPRLQAAALPYHVSADMRRPYWVCTGLQDNGSWCGPSSTRSGGIHMWNWISVGGGDGFQTQVDPTDPNIFYTESQNGNINRYDLNTGQTQNIRPAPGGGGGRGGGGGGAGGGGGGGRGNVTLSMGPDDDWPQSYNWNSPIRISPHNPSTILFAGTRFFVSRDRGNTWAMSIPLGRKIDPSQRTLLEKPYSQRSCTQESPGVACILSRNDGLQGQEFGTIIEIAESPVTPGVYWAGTNDGNIQVSRDGGFTWAEVGKNIPGGTKEYHISGIEASWYDTGTAYATIDGHYAGDLKPYVFKTTNFGQTWTSITGNLPERGNVNSIRQDPRNRNLVYAATEFGLYITLNDGGTWHRFTPNLPAGRIDEVLIHPRDNDLIVAHHGRGIWIMDDITPLQQLTPEAMNAEATLFRPREAVLWKTDRMNQTEVPGSKWWEGEVAPRGTAISYFLKSAPAGDLLVTITNTANGQAVRTCVGTKDVGMNRYQWTLTGNAPPGGGGGGRGGGRGGAPETTPAPPAGPQPCAGGGGGGGGRGGGGGFGGGGGGGIGAGVYKVTISAGGRELGSQTFSVVEDIWLNQK